MRILGRLCVFVMLAMPLSIVVGCGGSAGGGTTPPPPTTYTIGGTVSGLTGTGLVLQDNGGNNLSVSASGSFTFSTAIASGAAYSVTVLTQPTGQSCTVSSGSGTASANVSNVQVTCTTTTYTIGGTISGLTASGLVLADGSQTVSPASGATSFAFPTAVASGSSYAVTVKTQPSGETCSVTNGSGTASANVSNVQVTCTTTTYTIGGTVSGLTGTGLVLQDNSGNNLAVSASGSFAFSTAVASGAAYSVTVLTQPTGQSCTVTNGSGTVGANVTNVQVVCIHIGEWAWMGGSETAWGSPGIYGTLGMADPKNVPGARYQAVSWSDAAGNFWLFGGYGFDSTATGTQGYLNDLWEFNPKLGINGEWTWMGGINTRNQIGIYGTSGTDASTNIPGGRQAAVSWIDSSGNLWIFGGQGIDSTGADGDLNDLWKFDPALGTTGEWTWMGGSSTVGSRGQSGVYGTLGTAASNNTPGGRFTAVSWSDRKGNLWLFGGMGVDSTGAEGDLNDLWKFDPALGTKGEWTWMDGSNIAEQSGVYGTLGTVASTNIPGARELAMSWCDASGNLWLFGGYGFDSTGTLLGDLNDLWKFDPALGTTGEWTWMGGSTTVGSKGGQSGVYGTLGIVASTNIPGGRQAAVSWIDASGNLWLYGGGGFDSTGKWGLLNDLWEFNQKLGINGEWTWMGGSSTVGSVNDGQSGVYGTLGVAAPQNTPGGRIDAVSWIDASDNLWLFGGRGVYPSSSQGIINDLWMYQP